MKLLLIDLLICPACLPEEKRVTCRIIDKEREDILKGILICDACGATYPIQDGVASLLHNPPTDSQRARSRYESPALVSSYLWSHYADLLGDTDANSSYEEWAGLLGTRSGFCLDAGCSLGRFTFEMSRKNDFVIGIDNSHAFIRNARLLMREGTIKISIPEEGKIMMDGTIHLPEIWRREKVEFIVGDALSLPFRSELFPSLASLNLVDKIPYPLMHLKEINRVAKGNGAQFLFSDPFSWSSQIAKEEDWLGGRTKGPYQGRGIDNVSSLLGGKGNELLPPWDIEKKGHIWWKIRNHRNHFELIRSCYVKASR